MGERGPGGEEQMSAMRRRHGKGCFPFFYATTNAFLHMLRVRYSCSYAHNRPSCERREKKISVALVDERSKRKENER